MLEDVPADPIEVALRKKNSDAHNMLEDLIQTAKQSNEGMNFLSSSLSNLQATIKGMVPSISRTKQDEIESFIGTKIPSEVVIHPPNDVKSKGRCKRNKKSKETKSVGKKTTRTCSKCKHIGHHDSRNCPNKSV